MYAFGTGVIKLFAFTVGVGVLAGTASSIFIAAPLAYLMLGKFAAEKKNM
jgi:preprotein translocase subunit SecF